MVKNEPTPVLGDDVVIEGLKPLQLGDILLTCANVVTLLHRQNKDSTVSDLTGPCRFGDHFQDLIY